MTEKTQEWRWVGEDGVEKTVTEQELIAELSSESLPNYTLVWRKGWLEWLPAMQASELAWALPPGKADDAVKAREKDTAVQPPAPPLYRYPVLKRRAGNLRSDKAPPPRAAAARPDAKSIDPPTTVMEAPQKALAPPTTAMDEAAKTAPKQDKPREATIDPPTLVVRPVEEVEMDSIEASNPSAAEDLTDDVADADDSNPLAALKSAPAALGRAYGDEDDAETRVIPSRPPPPLGPLYVGPHVPPASERPPPSYESPAVETAPPSYDSADTLSGPGLPPLRAAPPPAFEDDEDMPHIPPPPPPPADLAAYAGAAGQRSAPPTLSRKNLYLGAGAGAALLVVVLAIALRGGGDDSKQAAATGSSAPANPAAEASASSKAAAAPERTAPGSTEKRCTVVTQAARIAEWAEPAIMPSFSKIPGSTRVAIGFAQTEQYALGITIDAKTLDRDQIFREFKKGKKLVSVVPTTDQGKLHFQVVRTGSELESGRAVDHDPPFFVGASKAGLERVRAKGERDVVWAFPSEGTDVTVPRVVSFPGVGHAVTFRRGGQAGTIAFGWLTEDGNKRTPLVDVPIAGRVGTPTLAASDDQALLAVAARSGEGTPWHVVLATAKPGELPKTVREFVPPAGGPGGDVISPAAAALRGGRFLFQWTEGNSGNRVVRAAVLGPDLSVDTAGVNVSPPGANAGQGAVFAHDDTGAVIFYVQNEKKSHELWGASLDCAE
ncbi:MAG TPA: hypothetical protein VHE30_03760 [Polyangiaceae bacterium]|nr:hypothetical protein [Polyangiaceae bacterium]